MSNEKMIYLASPYSHPDPLVRGLRFKEVSRIAGNLAAKGQLLICPIAMNHPMHIYADVEMPSDWAFWKRFDTELILRCDEVWVTMLDGWKDSVGVKAEMKLARELNIPIRYVEPETMVVLTHTKKGE